MVGLANKVIVLKEFGMGGPDRALAETVLANFLRLLGQQSEKPRAIFCYGEGVKLLAEESPALPLLKELANMGVPVQA